MDSITLGEISLAITFLVGLIGGLGYLKTHLKDWVGQSVRDQFVAMDHKIDEINRRLTDVDMENCKNFLVTAISMVEKGGWMDDIESERFWEEYQHYRTIGGNSYIERKVEQLKADGKI